MSLPALVLLSDYDATDYINVIYDLFKTTVVDANLKFLGLPIKCPWYPPHDGKHYSFWHLITNKFESDKEEDRLPDMRRCERVNWIAYVINNMQNHEKIWCWEKDIKTNRGRSKHIALYLQEEHYLVVLRRKLNRLELVTAYVKENHERVIKERSENKDPRIKN